MARFEVHECTFLSPGIRIEKSRSYFHDDFTWQIVVEREATEKDLEENHYLENVGDPIWSVVVEINHCPYCGEQLRENKIGNKAFDLFDSSGWSMQCL